MRGAVLGVLAVVTLTGCPPTGVVCQPGTDPCGTGCIDPVSDARNCGGCGIACGASQMCVDRACLCQPGTVSCGGQCVVTAYDARNCGACGVTCAAAEVCEQGSCRAACTLGSSVLCGMACVDTTADVGNCGACGRACTPAQSCRGSTCTFDVVAACASTGQLVGVSATSLSRGMLTPVGTSPAALAAYPGGVIALDAVDGRLLQAAFTSAGLTPVARANATGAQPVQATVEGDVVYVVNEGSGTLQVLRRDATADVILLDAGVSSTFPLGTVAMLSLGADTRPRPGARLGSSLWIPLYGGDGAQAAAGQAVVEVSVADPSAPAELRRVSLSGVELMPFDGGAALPRPRSAVAREGAVYVVLGNLAPGGVSPAGPGLLARIQPDAGTVTAVNLGAGCLDPWWAVPVGTSLAVSCGGASDAGAGVVLLDGSDVRTALWSASCAGPLPDGGACVPMVPGRMAARGNRLFVADQNGGRLVVLDVSGSALVPVRGLTNPIDTCPVGQPSGPANVSDIVAP